MDLSPVTLSGPFKGTLQDKHMVKKEKCLLASLLKVLHIFDIKRCFPKLTLA